MASTTLGKRTRNTKHTELDQSQELPKKRPRRTLRNTVSINIKNDENIKPAAAAVSEDAENQENQEPEIESTPTKTKSRSRRATVVDSDVKSPSVAPVTPSTPRHYDVFSKNATTPRHRVMSVGMFSRRQTPATPLTPSSSQTIYHQARQLFSRSADPGQLIGRDDERQRLQEFLSRCTTAHPNGCLYVSGPPGTGKSAMVNSVTKETVADSALIRKAYINCMSIKTSKDLYTTLLDQLVQGEEMVELSESDAVAALQKIFHPANKKSKDVFLVVLDEVDHILTLDLESMYRVCEWSMEKGSRLCLVGIANALDLTDRFLPRLKSRNLKPELLPVLPYSAPQIKHIIITRLKSLMPPPAEGAAPDNFIPFFHPAAIELCSRKVSTQTGDLRRAFEILRRAIDLIESETRMQHENEIKEQMLQMSPSRKVLGEKNLASLANGATVSSSTQRSTPSASTAILKSLQNLTLQTAPRVSISHLNKVTAAAFSNGTSQRLKTLNLQQKAALCALVAIERRNREKQSSTPITATPSKSSQVTAPTVKTLFEAYSLLCKRDSVLHPLSSSEFREVVSSLETLSLVSPVDGKTGSFIGGLASGPMTPSKRGRKPRSDFGGIGGLGLMGDEKRVASCVGEKEMESALEDAKGKGGGDLLWGILSGEALDD